MPFGDGPREEQGLSRRDFLGNASTAAGALALAPFLRLGLGSSGSGGGAGVLERAAEPAASRGLSSYIRDRMRTAHTPSVGVAAVRDQHLSWSSGFGWANADQHIEADADTVYMLASISKTVTCAAVMQLWEQGSLDLDADINGYLPFEVHNPNFPGALITARMLLTHTSSIRDRYSTWGTPYSVPTLYFHGDSPIALGDFLDSYLVLGGSEYFADKNFYDERPGRNYHYSNFGAALAGYMVEAIAGMPFSSYCTANIFVPLAMVQTGWHLADISTPNLAMPYRYHLDTGVFTPYFQYGYPDYPDGELRTSANALSRWLRCFMNFGELDGVRILKRSTVEEIRKPQIPGISWQGLIWYYHRRGGRVLLGHNGGDYGVSTLMFFDPPRNTGAIVLANRYLGALRPWQALQEIQDGVMARA